MAAQPVHRETNIDHRAALRGPAYEWAFWSTTLRVVTSDPHALPSARRLIDAELGRVELAASESDGTPRSRPFRPDGGPKSAPP